MWCQGRQTIMSNNLQFVRCASCPFKLTSNLRPSAEKPSKIKNTFLATSRFCVSNHPSCDDSSECGHYFQSIEHCKKAVMQLLLVTNESLAVLSLRDEHAPKGCLLDAQLRAYFNAAGKKESDYTGLMSVCALRASNGESSMQIGSSRGLYFIMRQ